MSATDTPIYHQLFLEYATNDVEGRELADAILRRKQAQLHARPVPVRLTLSGWFLAAVNWR